MSGLGPAGSRCLLHWFSRQAAPTRAPNALSNNRRHAKQRDGEQANSVACTHAQSVRLKNCPPLVLRGRG